tara:strand:+ start:1462 stop:3027 length:1566 start_codon:yes stop_codon:yes gene_type:complete
MKYLYILLPLYVLFSKELPIGLTNEEKLRIHEIPLMARQTDPPIGPIRNIAEYEKMQGVLIRYPFGIPIDLITEIAEDVKIFCLVSNNQQNAAQNALVNAGIDVNNIDFILGNTDSYWTRDYGPWWIINGENKMSVVDFTYNRPRQNDNQAPLKISQHLDVPYYASDIIHAGGNYMTDGFGTAASSDLVFEENQNTDEQILDLMNSYYGIDNYHVINDPNNTYIDHIDCWGKYLSPTKVLIRDVPESHPQFNQIEETASYFTNTLNKWNEPWEVYRVWTPGNEPYTNSLIINEKVLVPLTGSLWDNAAIESYNNAMPGYEVLGFSGTWESTDALHCRTKGIPDLEMLQIFHNPLNNLIEPAIEGYKVTVEVEALSDSGILSDSMKVFFKKQSDLDWSFRQLEIDNSTDQQSVWSGYIPSIVDTSMMLYYIQVADSSGRIEKNPLGGWHIFSALPTDICNDWLLGDLNSTGFIDVYDILKVSDEVSNSESLGICTELVSDINNDGQITVVDIILIVSMLFSQ